MKRVLITGIAGFIGFHTARELLRSGHSVLGIDHFNSYYDPALKERRAANLECEIIRQDINEIDPNLIDRFEPTHILHLAAQAGVRHCLNEPFDYTHSNVNGLLSILEICRQRPGLKLVYASSSSAHDPENLYGATKAAGELMVQSYHRCFKIPAIGLRYFTVYGPWGRPDMAYYKFSNAMRLNQPIQLHNKGQMDRDFTYIDDIVDGTISALDCSLPHAIFDLGNGTPQPLNTLVQLLEKYLDTPATIEHLPMQTGERISTCANISPAATHLNYRPKVSLSEGIRRFTAWHNSIQPVLAT